MKAIYLNQHGHALSFPEIEVNANSDRNKAIKLLKDSDLFVLDYTNFEQTLEEMRAVRQNPNPLIYLKPVILLKEEQLPLMIANAADGTYSRDELGEELKTDLMSKIIAINAKISSLPQPGEMGDVNVILKFVRMLYTRNVDLNPVMTTNALQGYVYPMIETFFSTMDGSSFKTLELLEGQGLIMDEFKDRSYSCSVCGSSFLNFREVCSDCGSPNLAIDDLVHHFRCANVSPLSDYARNGQMICPKCDRKLKQIGVDYDKPSQIYVCKKCGRTTQDAATQAKCYNCQTDSKTENLQPHEIKSFTLTGLGQNAAIYGIEQIFTNILESTFEVVPLNVLKKYIDIEAERIKRYGRSESTLIMLRIDNLNEIYLTAGARAHEVFTEFSEILRQVFRISDLISILNESSFVSLLVETPKSGADTALRRIEERVNSLVNFNFGITPKLITRSSPVDAERNAEQLIHELTEL